MNRAQRWTLDLAVILTTLTGVVFAVMKYFMKSDDPFAVANHPWQPHMLSVHVVAAPVLLFALGWTFGNHIWPKFNFGGPKHRRTGIAGMLLIAPMTLSAYLLQISTGDAMRQAMAVAHWVTSGVFVVAYAAHLWLATRK